MYYESILNGFDERTAVLIGLGSSSLLKRAGKGSRGASSEQGGEGKDLHDCALKAEML